MKICPFSDVMILSVLESSKCTLGWDSFPRNVVTTVRATRSEKRDRERLEKEREEAGEDGSCIPKQLLRTERSLYKTSGRLRQTERRDETKLAKTKKR